jgi:DNA polymerase-3 subunit epsilon
MIETHNGAADTVVVFDFETTGLSPQKGDRAIEIGAVLIRHGQIEGTFSELMNPGFKVSAFISEFTGITNAMLRQAPPCEEVMRRFAGFLGEHNAVAHNARFDARFLKAELERIASPTLPPMACTMLCARRLYPKAPNHRLGTLVEFCRLRREAQFHRALDDSLMTARLWLTMLDDIRQEYGRADISFALMQKLAKTSVKSVAKVLGEAPAA